MKAPAQPGRTTDAGTVQVKHTAQPGRPTHAGTVQVKHTDIHPCIEADPPEEKKLGNDTMHTVIVGRTLDLIKLTLPRKRHGDAISGTRVGGNPKVSPVIVLTRAPGLPAQP